MGEGALVAALEADFTEPVRDPLWGNIFLSPGFEAVAASPDSYVAYLAAALGPVCSWPRTLGTWRSHAENAGKSSRFSYRDYWVPVVLPEINRRLAEWGVPVVFEHRPAAVLLEPLRQLREARERRRRKAAGLPPFG